MEYQKVTNLLGTMPNEVPRFITNKWIEVHDQPRNAEDRWKPSKQIIFKTSMLRSDLWDFSDAYIVAKGTITITGTHNRSSKNRPLAFKNNAPFISCISKINNTLIDNAEDLLRWNMLRLQHVVMPMYFLIECSKIYRKTTGSLQNYYRDELTDDTNDINFPNKNVSKSESFKYKTSVTGSTYNVDAKITNVGNEINNPTYDSNKSGKKEVEIVVRLKLLID